MDSTNKTTQKKSSNQQHSDFNQKMGMLTTKSGLSLTEFRVLNHSRWGYKLHMFVWLGSIGVHWDEMEFHSGGGVHLCNISCQSIHGAVLQLALQVIVGARFESEFQVSSEVGQPILIILIWRVLLTYEMLLREGRLL